MKVFSARWGLHGWRLERIPCPTAKLQMMRWTMPRMPTKPAQWGRQCQQDNGWQRHCNKGHDTRATRAMMPARWGQRCQCNWQRCWCNAGNDATRQTWCCSFSASTGRGPPQRGLIMPSTTAQPPRLTVATREGSASPRHAVAVERQMLWRRLSSTGLWIVEFEAWHEINHNRDRWVTQTRLLRTSFLWVTFQ